MDDRKEFRFEKALHVVGGQILTRASSQKDLGVTITSDLKWDSHIKNVVSKAYRMLGFLRKNTANSYFNSHTKK